MPNEAQREIIDAVVQQIVKRRLITALMMLEMSRPLNYVSTQAMHFLTPVVSAVTDTKGYEQFAMFLEKRKMSAYMCARIEALQTPTPSDEGQSAEASHIG